MCHWRAVFQRGAWPGAFLWKRFFTPGWGNRPSAWGLPDTWDPRRCVGCESGVTSESINKLCHQGQLREAVESLGFLVHRDRRVSRSLFFTVLKECVAEKDLHLGRIVHALAVKEGYGSDTFLCTHILRMYASHSTLKEAMTVFTMVATPDAFMWSAVISAYVKHGEDKQAIRLYHRMCRSGVQPDGHVFVAALQACARGLDLKSGQQVHADVLACGVEPDEFVSGCLVDMYAKCGSLEDAKRVFDGLPHKSVVTWSSMITGYAQQGMGREALHLYRVMQGEGIVKPNSVIFVSLLQACASLGRPGLDEGKRLHAQIREHGLDADLFVGSSTVNMYAKCGSLIDARSVFDGLDQKNVVTWNAMLAGYSQQGMEHEALDLYRAMEEEGVVVPVSLTFVSLLQACAKLGSPALEIGKHLHAQIRQRGIHADVVVANSLVNMYAKCGSPMDAQGVFDGLGQKDVVTWNAMIGGYVNKGMLLEAFQALSVMKQGGLAAPNSVTFMSLLQACARVGTPALNKGKQIHEQIRERGLQANVFVANSLINMYAKCGSVHDAEGIFHALPEKDVATWNAMIAGYSQHGMGQEALGLYRAMQDGTAAPDSVTFVCLLQACAQLGTPGLEMGKQLHTQIRGQGLDADLSVASSLLNMYAKCGSLESARGLFDKLCEKNVVTWSAMIAGYSQQDMGQEALHLYRTMQDEGIVALDSVTFVCLLQACASVAALHLGRQLHAHIKVQKLQGEPIMRNSLINMYAKSGSMLDAQQVFDELPERDVVTWTALIAGYTSQGESNEVFDLFLRMREDGIEPDGITFLSVLTACSHKGLVNKAGEYFEAMIKNYRITPTPEHYTCMVDLLGRAGQLDEALALIRTMPVQPDAAVWHALLGACQKWNNVEVGRHAFHEAVKLDLKDGVAYVLMSNIYSGVQMWEQSQEMKLRRTRNKAWKQPGQSWWTDMDGLVHSFLVGDKNGCVGGRY